MLVELLQAARQHLQLRTRDQHRLEFTFSTFYDFKRSAVLINTKAAFQRTAHSIEQHSPNGLYVHHTLSLVFSCIAKAHSRKGVSL